MQKQNKHTHTNAHLNSHFTITTTQKHRRINVAAMLPLHHFQLAYTEHVLPVAAVLQAAHCSI